MDGPVRSADELADVLANRLIIEQAKGMLMTIYGINAEQAFEFLTWRSQSTNVKLRTLARHVVEAFPALAADGRSPSKADYDRILRSA